MRQSQEGRALRQFTLSTGKSAGRNSSGRITVFHRGGGSKRLQRRIDLKRSTSSMGIVERIEYDPNRSSRIAPVRWIEGVQLGRQRKCNTIEEFAPPRKILEPTTTTIRGPFSFSSLPGKVDQRKSFRRQETLGLVGAAEHNESKPKTDQGSLPAKPIGEGPKDGTCKVDRAPVLTSKHLIGERGNAHEAPAEREGLPGRMPMGAGFFEKARADSETWDLGLATNEGKLEELSPPAAYVVVGLIKLAKERGLQVLRKSRTRQLTYGSGAEPQHRGLGQHLYNSQSSIGSGQDAKKGRVEGGSQLAASWPRPPAYRYEILDLNSQIGNCIPLADIRIGTWVHDIECHPGQGAKLARAAGTFAKIMKEPASPTLSLRLVRLPSGVEKVIDSRCRATIGIVSNPNHGARKFRKAGQSRWLGRRPIVRGVAMNPVDHPHGGGEGRTKGGRPSASPWGKPTKAGFRAGVGKGRNEFMP
ncbi:hypothetical protein ACSBR1_043931 (mitochondrion) [Camellia fascicularis]